MKKVFFDANPFLHDSQNPEINYIFFTALSVIKSINSPYLKLQLDIFHLQHISGNLTKSIETLLPFVGKNFTPKHSFTFIKKKSKTLTGINDLQIKLNCAPKT